MSPQNAGLAKKAGYTNIRVYVQGLPAWQKAGNQTVTAKKFIEKGNIILVDLRSEKKSKRGRIPRSITLPLKKLADRLDEFPENAPIVLYSDKKEDAIKALTIMRKEGLHKITLVPGMFQGWLKAGGKLTKGPLVTQIKWQKKPGKNEVGIVNFKKAITGKAKHNIVLDVRTKPETTTGKFKNSIAIPLDELSKRLGELPKNKMIYIHCSSGPRAETATEVLLKNGYRAKYLEANVSCKGSKCTIGE